MIHSFTVPDKTHVRQTTRNREIFWDEHIQLSIIRRTSGASACEIKSKSDPGETPNPSDLLACVAVYSKGSS
jgi:hypothetical protein